MTGMITEWLPAPNANGPISCAACGCRLTEAEDGMWRHFPSLHHDRDARGCRPACVQARHDRTGHAVEATGA